MLLLQFLQDSERLSLGELAQIQQYARIFARLMADDVSAKLQLGAVADQSEKMASQRAVSRLVAVRRVLVQNGVSADRIRATHSVGDTGEAAGNRRVEAALGN